MLVVANHRDSCMIDALLLTLSTLAPGRTMPSPAVPLHELVAQSGLVAVVRPGVGAHMADADDFSGAPDTRVELAVEEVLLGKSVASVTAAYWADLVCPSPPEFPAGERVLAFLAHHEEWGWYPIALSDGTKLLEPATLDVYRARIRELAALMEARPKRWHATPEFVEWLVRCAEDPGSRWEGARALDPERYFFGDEPEWARSFGERLDAEQRSRLAAVLFAAPDFGRGEASLLRALVAEPGHAFRDQALAELPSLPLERRYFASQLIQELARRSRDVESKRTAKELVVLSRNEPPDPQVMRVIADFVRRARALEPIEYP